MILCFTSHVPRQHLYSETTQSRYVSHNFFPSSSCRMLAHDLVEPTNPLLVFATTLYYAHHDHSTSNFNHKAAVSASVVFHAISWDTNFLLLLGYKQYFVLLNLGSTLVALTIVPTLHMTETPI